MRKKRQRREIAGEALHLHENVPRRCKAASGGVGSERTGKRGKSQTG